VCASGNKGPRLFGPGLPSGRSKNVFIQATEMLNTPVGRNVSELLRLVEAFKYIREHPGEVYPAGWEPGVPTLKAFPALAGKVWDVWKPQKA